MKWLLLALMLAFCSTASAFSLYEYQGRCGSAKVALGDTGGREGVTQLRDDGWWITLDPRFIRAHSPYAVEFLFFHECGHVTYGHTSAYSPHASRDEKDADCYAKNRFERTYGRRLLWNTLKELEPINGRGRNHQIRMCE